MIATACWKFGFGTDLGICRAEGTSIAADEFAGQRAFDLARTVRPTGVNKRTVILADFLARQRANDATRTRGLFANLAESICTSGSAEDDDGEKPSFLYKQQILHFGSPFGLWEMGDSSI